MKCTTAADHFGEYGMTNVIKSPLRQYMFCTSHIKCTFQLYKNLFMLQVLEFDNFFIKMNSAEQWKFNNMQEVCCLFSACLLNAHAYSTLVEWNILLRFNTVCFIQSDFKLQSNKSAIQTDSSLIVMETRYSSASVLVYLVIQINREMEKQKSSEREGC